MAKYTHQQIKDLAEEMEHAKDSERPFALLTGAGCSISAGIPSANSLIKEINESPKFKNRLRSLKDEYCDDYGLCMRKLPKNMRKELLTPYLEQAKVNWAHIAIASMMKEGFIERALTFNFDNILSRANGLCGQYPAIYDYVTGASNSTDHIVSPCIIHLHGQGYGLSMLNSDLETRDHAKRIEPLLRNTLDQSPILVIGYSGQADEVFPKIAEVFDGKETLHWCDYEEDPSKDVRELLNCYKDLTHHYGGVDADVFLVELAQALDCFPPKVFVQPLDHLRDEIKDVLPFPSGDESDKLDVLGTMNAKLDNYESHKSVGLNNQDYYQNLFMKGNFYQIIKDSDDGKSVPENILSRSYFSEAYNKGKYKNKSVEQLNEVISLYQQAIFINADSPASFNNLANTFHLLGELTGEKNYYEQAVVKSEKAIELNPNDGSYYNNLGITLWALGKLTGEKNYYEEAVVKSEKAIELNPDDGSYYNNLANTFGKLGNLTDEKKYYEEAVVKSEKAIELIPDDGEYYNHLACTLQFLGVLTGEKNYYEKAVINSEKAIELKSDNGSYYNRLAITFAHLGKLTGKKSYYKQAVAKSEKAIELNPDDGDYYNILANVLRDLGKLTGEINYTEQAIAKAEKAIEIEPDGKGYYNNLGVALMDLGMLTGEQSYYKRARIIFKTAENAMYNLACLESTTGNISGCEKYLNNCYEEKTLPAKAHMENDSDLDPVREFKWFKELLEKIS